MGLKYVWQINEYKIRLAFFSSSLKIISLMLDVTADNKLNRYIYSVYELAQVKPKFVDDFPKTQSRDINFTIPG